MYDTYKIITCLMLREDCIRELSYDDITWNLNYPIACESIGYQEYLPRWNYWEELKEVSKN